MNQIDNLEKRLSAIETTLNMQHDEKPAPAPDPYLVPGVPCEVWDDGDGDSKYLAWFSCTLKTGRALFTKNLKGVGDGNLSVGFDHYRVLGTVWDHAPEWAEWVATDKCGFIAFHETQPFAAGNYWESHRKTRRGIAEDVIDGWQNPPIKRPSWAKRKV